MAGLMRFRSATLFLFAAVCSSGLRVRAEDRPQWGERYTRNMVSPERGLVESFDPASGKGVRWRVPLGTQSYATPVVAGGRVLIGANNEVPRDPKHTFDAGVLMCFDVKD